MHRLTVLFVGGLCAFLLNMCYGPSTGPMGRVQADVAGRTVIVTDCYRLEEPLVEWMAGHTTVPPLPSEAEAPPVVTVTAAPAALLEPTIAATGRSGQSGPADDAAPLAPPTPPAADATPTPTPAAPPTPTPADGASWRFAPCRDAVVVIQGDQLTVNGVPYGAVALGDVILIDHGVVYVNGILRQSI